MDPQVQKVVDVYRKVALIPSVVNAALIPGKDSKYILESIWQQRDLEREENVKFKKHSSLSVNDSKIKVEESLHSSETSGELLTRYTKCGKLKAVIREVTNKEKNKIQYLEIWDRSKKLVNVNLKEADKHGVVHSNIQFGCLEWSRDNKRILYVAETKIPKSGSFFKPGEQKEDSSFGDEHLYRESWGEQLVDSQHPTICVFDVDSKEISTFSEIIPEDISAGQGIWCHDNDKIAFIGWNHEPHRLGLIYCPMRKSDIYSLELKQKTCTKITDGSNALSSTRLHPFENKIVYLENEIGGPHQNCSKLVSLDLPTKNGDFLPQNRVLVDIVMSTKTVHEFPGLFLLNLPQNCWSKDGKYVFLSSTWRSRLSVLAVHFENGEMDRLTDEGEASVLDVMDDIIVISCSNPASPPKIRAGKFREGTEMKWSTIECPSEDIPYLKWSVHPFKPDIENPEYPNIVCDYLLFKPTDPSIKPGSGTLIVNPHGGPHSRNIAWFMHSTAALCKLGYSVVQVNYRGSTGFGKNAVDSLIGNVGTQDVLDVQQVAELVKQEHRFERVVVTGGSHGGFLTLHLIAQYPNFYKAACARNPVTNFVSKFALTDIPDWNWCESGLGDYAHDTLPTSESYAVMLEKSPIARITNAKVPCLIMLGDVDLRVPPTQGLEWGKKYKALGRICKILIYEGNNHPLNKVDAEADGFVNMVLWFLEHSKV